MVTILTRKVRPLCNLMNMAKKICCLNATGELLLLIDIFVKIEKCDFM